MIEILIIVLLILLNGVFSMSEIAVISARKSSLQTDVKNGSKAAKAALQLSEDPDKFLSTVQIGITLIGILTGIYSGATISYEFARLLIGWGLTAGLSKMLAQTLIVVVVTYLSITIGELVPKRIGLSNPERMAKLVSRPMLFLSTIAAPCVWILAHSTERMFKTIGLKDQESKVTEEEIKSIVQEGKESGTVQDVEKDIVDRVFVLGDLKVNSLMTHRSDITTIDIESTVQEIRDIIRETPFESYPVVDYEQDSVEGILLLKDIVFTIDRPNFNLKTTMRPVVYFHENMSVYKCLEQMKARSVSRACVCDEFGSFEGIITLRDILEGLVGTINEPNNEPEIIKRSDGQSWLVDGQCSWYNFLSYFDCEDLYEKSDTYSTLAGLIIEQMKHIPQSGEKTTWKTFHFEIVDMDGARIDKVLVTKKEK